MGGITKEIKKLRAAWVKKFGRAQMAKGEGDRIAEMIAEFELNCATIVLLNRDPQAQDYCTSHIKKVMRNGSSEKS